MKRVKLDHTEMEKEVQNQSSEEDGKVVNTTVTVNHVAEDGKHGYLYHATLAGDHKNLEKFLKSGKYEGENLKGTVEYMRQRFRYSLLTPLHVAVKLGDAKCAQILIDNGMNVNAQDEKLRTPLHLAAEKGIFHCLKLLLEAGACTSATSNSMHPLVRNCPEPGNTALHLAAMFNQVDCVKELIRFGADRCAVDAYGYTSLQRAADMGLRECFIAHISDIHDTASLPRCLNYYLDTAMYIAIEKGMVDCVKAILRLGLNVHLINIKSHWMSTLQLICSSEKIDFDAKKEILKLLIFDQDTDISNALEPDFYDMYDLKVKRFLIAYGASIDFKPKLSGFETYFEYELFSYRFPNLLEFIMHFIPQLPLLPTFFELTEPIDWRRSLCKRYNTLPSTDQIWLDSTLPKDVEFDLVTIKKHLYVRMIKKDDSVIPPNEDYYIPRSLQRSFEKFIPLKQPFLDLVHEAVTEQLEEIKDVVIPKQWPGTSAQMRKIGLMKLWQQLWYHKIATNPRTLQHHCRFAIRKLLGLTNLKFVMKLPIPKHLQAYLFFE